MPKASKKRINSAKVQDKKRKQRRFATSSAYMPLWVGLVGMFGCLVLGSGVFGLWIAEPPHAWASYLVAAGGLGLGISLWFGTPAELAVAVGDAGVLVERGRQTQRIHWYEVRAIRCVSGHLVVESAQLNLKFLIGANRSAAAYLLKEAAERVPDVIDVDPDVLKTLPNPKEVRGIVEAIEDDQVAGARCAASNELIRLEENARLCARCGQVYDQAHMPSACVSCNNELGPLALTA